MARSKSDDKADTAKVAAVRLDVEAMGTKVEGLQGEVTEVNRKLSRMEEMISRMEALMAKDPPAPPVAPDGSQQNTALTAVQPETSAAGERRKEIQNTSPILDRGTPV
jgi:paraquat-inducible protein B